MCLNRPWGHPFDSDGGAQNSNPTLSHDLNDPTTATLARTTAAQNILYCVRLLRRTARCPNSPPIAAQGTTPVPRHPPSVKNVSDQVRRPSTFAITEGLKKSQATLHTSAKILALTSRAPRAQPSSKTHNSSLPPPPNQRLTKTRRPYPMSSRTSSCFFFLLDAVCVFLRIVGVDRSGTANRILEAKEKQREKEKEKTDRATKRTKR